jgi:hypothetical protein
MGAAVANPKARYFQWRATLKGKDASLSYASLIFLPQNIAPEITSLTVLPANVGLQPNPSAPADPNIELSGLDPAIFGLPTTAAPPRRLYQRGAVSLQWTASDENDDTLVYDVAFRAVGQTAWTELRTGLTDNFLTIDGQSLADGRYNFRVTARDSVSNPANLALSGERLTDAIEIDNTAPTVTESGPRMLASGRIAIAFKATDTSSFISRAEYSVDGGNWQPIYPEDGIADGLTERFIVDVPSGTSSSLTIRVYDANGNSAAYRVTLK